MSHSYRVPSDASAIVRIRDCTWRERDLKVRSYPPPTGRLEASLGGSVPGRLHGSYSGMARNSEFRSETVLDCTQYGSRVANFETINLASPFLLISQFDCNTMYAIQEEQHANLDEEEELGSCCFTLRSTSTGGSEIPFVLLQEVPILAIQQEMMTNDAPSMPSSSFQ